MNLHACAVILLCRIISVLGFTVWIFSAIYNLVQGWNQPANTAPCVVTCCLSLLVTIQNTSGAMWQPNGLFVWEWNPSDRFRNPFPWTSGNISRSGCRGRSREVLFLVSDNLSRSCGRLSRKVASFLCNRFKVLHWFPGIYIQGKKEKRGFTRTL